MVNVDTIDLTQTLSTHSAIQTNKDGLPIERREVYYAKYAGRVMGTPKLRVPFLIRTHGKVIVASCVLLVYRECLMCGLMCGIFQSAASSLHGF